MGHAVPHRIGRHVHHKARPDDTTPPAATATGIDYLELIEAQHTREISERLCYSQLPDQPTGHLPDGPQTLPGITDPNHSSEQVLA